MLFKHLYIGSQMNLYSTLIIFLLVALSHD